MEGWGAVDKVTPRKTPIRDVFELTDEECEQIDDILKGIDKDEVIDSVTELVKTMSERDKVHFVAGIVSARIGFVVSLR